MKSVLACNVTLLRPRVTMLVLFAQNIRKQNIERKTRPLFIKAER